MNLKNRSELTDSLLNTLELPQDICLGRLKCTIYGNRELLIENGRCILEYTNEEILVKGKNAKVQICGKRLLIAEYTKEYICVCGAIESIHFV